MFTYTNTEYELQQTKQNAWRSWFKTHLSYQEQKKIRSSRLYSIRMVCAVHTNTELDFFGDCIHSSPFLWFQCSILWVCVVHSKMIYMCVRMRILYSILLFAASYKHLTQHHQQQQQQQKQQRQKQKTKRRNVINKEEYAFGIKCILFSSCFLLASKGILSAIEKWKYHDNTYLLEYLYRNYQQQIFYLLLEWTAATTATAVASAAALLRP